MNNNYAELFDDDGEALRDGDQVRVNGEFAGILRLDGMGKFHLEDWPDDRMVHSLQLVKRATPDEK